MEPDDTVISKIQAVNEWLQANAYQQSAVAKFMQGADQWLVAHALAYNWNLVTREKPENTKKKIKIPNICDGLEISYVTYHEMLQKEGARFVLERRG